MKEEIIIPEEAGLCSERLARIKPVMQTYVDQQKLSGVSTMIARKGKVVHFEQVGLMDIESGKPMTNNAIFRIYSMTKPIVCTALMMLYEQGRFRLFDPVAKFIPAFADLKVLESDVKGGTKEVDLERPVTISNLMTHTAGLTYDFQEVSLVSELYRKARLANDTDRTLEEMIHELVRFPLAFQPASRWHYSLSVDVVAHLIEVLSGQSLNQFLQENLFKPLGMTDTGFCVSPDKQDRLATMYGRPDLFGPDMTLSQLTEAWKKGFNEKIDVSESYPVAKSDSFVRGGHGLYSTAWDYMRFALMLLNQGERDGERILGRKTLALMQMNHLPMALLPYQVAGLPVMGYGFGLGSRVLMNVAESEVPGSLGEFGGSGAAKTYYWVDPQEEIVGLLMTQSMIDFDLPEKDFQVLAYQALTH